MNIDELLKLVDKVSDSKLSRFKYKDEYTLVVLEKDFDNKTKSKITVKKNDTENLNNTITEEKCEISKKSIKSPLVGTFYKAPSKDSEDYVKVGDNISKGQIIGIIESMKLMNEIESDCDGIVTEILVGNEECVEYGQPLIILS